MDKLFSEERFPTVDATDFVQDYDCLEMMVTGFEEMCGRFSSYSLKYVSKLADACDT